MYIEKSLINMFRDDLCKDQREIAILDDSVRSKVTGKIMRKYNLSASEFDEELSVITHLHACGMDGIPTIFGTGVEDCNGVMTPYLDIEYFDGIRVYNVLAYIRMIDSSDRLYSGAQQLKQLLSQKCLDRQIKIQNALMDWAKKNEKTEIYPQAKLRNIVYMLSSVMNLNVDFSKLDVELKQMTEEFNKRAVVPFRDSTTKNMLIYSPELYLGKFVEKNADVLAADDARFAVFKQMLADGSYKELIADKMIVDFDFSSCEHLTTPYDDPIGYNCHEIMYNGIPNSKSLVWNEMYDTTDNLGIAISFIMRFLRFGGRKLSYHIFHPNAYKFRFRYDDENFYFNYLGDIVRSFYPKADTQFPEFMKFVAEVVRYNKEKVIDDIDEFEEENIDSNRKFYVDVFPY